MTQTPATTETILVVDDEEPVRRTFGEWLAGAGLNCTVLSASDAESALQLANKQTIDLAILDWHLGAGDDGLQLLQDLYEFNPNVIAIMVTGFANQATPLDAMRMGVRDYLDKNQDLNKETFLTAVRRQLEHIRPAKRERQLHQSLVAFRETVEKILPLVQSAAALNDPVPLPDASGWDGSPTTTLAVSGSPLTPSAKVATNVTSSSSLYTWTAASRQSTPVSSSVRVGRTASRACR